MVAATSAMPATVTTLPAGSKVSGSGGGMGALLGQNEFLQLLTAQLEKQNPLNPTNPSDFAAELAQFSTATGVEQLNSALASANGMQAAALVGHSVAVPGNTLVLGTSGAKGGFNLPSDAKNVIVTVSNSSGSPVATLNLGAVSAGDQSFAWDGKSLAGATLPPGNYSFTVSATGATGAVQATAYSVVPVTAVSLNAASGPMLDIGGGLSPVALSAVRQVF
jgi:flagellar basal-body rod modification protein FlgD